MIHRQDQVEAVEIVSFNTPCALTGNIDAVGCCHLDRAAIGLLALVPAAGSGGIDLVTSGKSGVVDTVPEDAFGKR